MCRLIALMVFAICISGPALSGETRICSDPAISAMAPREADRTMVCQMAVRAKLLLERCDLTLPKPVEFALVDSGDELEMAGYLGHYSPRNDRVSLLSASELIELLGEDSAFRALPEDHLFESIVVHEMTHAFIVPTECGRRICRPAHEYIAYALQIESLPEASRNMLLAAIPATEDRELSYFSSFLLDIAPEHFAVEAWRHFSMEGNGCEFIASVLREDVQFPMDDE